MRTCCRLFDLNYPCIWEILGVVKLVENEADLQSEIAVFKSANL